YGAHPGRQRLVSPVLAPGSQRVPDAPLTQLEYRLPKKIVDAVEVIEKHLVRRAGRPRGTPKREVHQAVDREVVGDTVEQFPASRLAARRPGRTPVTGLPRCAPLRGGAHLDSIHDQTSSHSKRTATSSRPAQPAWTALDRHTVQRAGGPWIGPQIACSLRAGSAVSRARGDRQQPDRAAASLGQGPSCRAWDPRISR